MEISTPAKVAQIRVTAKFSVDLRGTTDKKSLAALLPIALSAGGSLEPPHHQKAPTGL